MASKISASVGKGGKNNPEDVKTVQELLNDFTSLCGFKKLKVDGFIGPDTLTAIKEVQEKAVGMKRADSRVDPGKDTFKTLTTGPKKAEAEIKKAEQAEKEKKEAAEAKKKGKEEEAPKEGKSQLKGDYRGIDKKILAVLEAVSAHYGKPIDVVKGKQRLTESGEMLWQNWTSLFERGTKGVNLDGQLRKQLNDLYNDRKSDEFMKLVDDNSRSIKDKISAAHASGHAFDLKRNTDSKIVAALSTILRYEDEGNVIHFDDTGKSIPSKIDDSMKRKWK